VRRRRLFAAAAALSGGLLLAGCSTAPWDASQGYDLHLKNTGTVAVTIAFCVLGTSDCSGKGTVQPGACRAMWFDSSQGLDGRGAQIRVTSNGDTPGYVYVQPSGENLTYGLGPTWPSLRAAQSNPSVPLSGGC